jgi:hypothetical protein
MENTKLDPQRFRDLAMNLWLDSLGADSRAVAEAALRIFNQEIGLDLVDLLWEARRTQDTHRIQSVLIRFYDRCLALGLKESTAWEYCKKLRLFFLKNRIPLHKKLERKPVPTVSLQLLDATR